MSKKKLYIDLDSTLVDFGARVDGLDPIVLEAFDGRLDEVPGIFAVMRPMPGGIEAFKKLSVLFDIYILSTAPWLNPSAWQHKVEWVQLHLGIDDDSPAYKRLILTHHKDLNLGEFLVDDRPHNGAAQFGQRQGSEWIKFGTQPTDSDGYSIECADWAEVTEYLSSRA
jgi:5'(3')-deoxyribonucleotidase